MLRHCILVLLVAPLLALPALAEEITLTVHGDATAGTLPTYFEPSAFFGWTSTPMKQDFAADAGLSHGLIVESTQLLLGPSTSLADYQARLEQSGLATEAALVADAGAQFLLQVHGMPRWISKSSVTTMPPGCEEEWPTYQTVAPDPAKWADWEAAIAATVTYFNVTHGLSNVWYQLWEEPDASVLLDRHPGQLPRDLASLRRGGAQRRSRGARRRSRAGGRPREHQVG